MIISCWQIDECQWNYWVLSPLKDKSLANEARDVCDGDRSKVIKGLKGASFREVGVTFKALEQVP